VLTEQEQKVENQLRLIELAKLARNSFSSLKDISKILPFAVTVSTITTVDKNYKGFIFCNPYIEQILNVDQSQVINAGWNYTRSFIHPSNLRYQQNFISQFNKSANEKDVLSYYQYLTKKGHSEYYWLHTEKISLDTNHQLGMNYELPRLGLVYHHLKNILGEICMDSISYQKFCSLTKTERKVLKYILDGNTNKEIGLLLFVSEHTIRTHRNRIWRKLDISHFKDSFKYSYFF
tara:strand:+ start:27 stop:728 length:702 start_codon:yes stop_codon:yes gene_type:complete